MMGEYMAHITRRLLAAIKPDREPPLAAQSRIKRFKDQMVNHGSTAPEDELERNRLFLVMHEEVCAALEVTRQAEGGPEALLRLDASVSTSGAWNV
jgi:hypothetical protein